MNEPQKVTFSQGIHEESATQKEILGCKRELADGRKFRYTHNGGVALVAGVPTIAAASVANHVNCAVAAAAAVGDMRVSVTLGATAATLNQYKDGFLQINDGAGEGLQYAIEGNPVIGSAGTGWIQLKSPIRVALTTAASKVSLIYNMQDLVVAATAPGEPPTGIPPIAVTISYYYWSQTGGLGCAAVTNTVGIGQKLVLGAALTNVAAAHDDPVVGYTFGTAGVTGNYKPVFLTID